MPVIIVAILVLLSVIISHRTPELVLVAPDSTGELGLTQKEKIRETVRHEPYNTARSAKSLAPSPLFSCWYLSVTRSDSVS